MALDMQQIDALLDIVSRTREVEIDCDECFADMAEFAELELVGAEIPEALERIRAHTELCPECAEEYALLLAVVRSTDAP